VSLTVEPGLGWLKDPYDARDRTAAALFSLPATAPNAGSLVLHRGPRIRQGGTSACVAFAGSRVIRMGLSIQGVIAAPLPSMRFGYGNARRQEWAGLDPDRVPAVEDRGSYPRLYLEAVRKLGFVPEHVCPFSEERVNAPISPLTYALSYDQRGLSYYRLEQGDVFDNVGEAMKRGVPCMFAMTVDRAFLHHSSSKPIDTIDRKNLVGGHMMAALEWTPEAVLIDNWWGPDWGCDGEGWAWISRRCFEEHARDVFGILAVPQLARRQVAA